MSNNQNTKSIVRKRNILSCKRCYVNKRKCGKEKPECKRCVKAKSQCEYFTRFHIEQRSLQRKRTAVKKSSTYKLSSINEDASVPDTELNPTVNGSGSTNFKLIVNETGEYSKYLPLGLFPFSEPSTNVSYIVDRLPNERDKLVVFDFSTMIKQMSGIEEMKYLIPSKPLSDQLVNHFFQHVHPFIPIIDNEEFSLKYNQLWDHFDSFSDLNGLILIFAVYFTSCTSLQLSNMFRTGRCQVEEDGVNYEELKQNAFQCIGNIRYMMSMNISPSISNLIALTLIYYVASLNCYGIVGEVSALTKYCQMTGLHRKLSNNEQEIPLRNLLYSYVIFLDTQTSYYNGLASSINKDVFETYGNFPKALNDLSILHSLARLHNGLVSSDVIVELNRIKPPTLVDLERMKKEFNESEKIVNYLNNEILKFANENRTYLEWLTTEGRLGLRKSALLLNFLEDSITNGNSQNQISMNSHELLIQSMLLVNESLMKIVLGVESGTQCLWFIRNSYPFQAMWVILKSVKSNPGQEVNFSDLDVKIEYTKHHRINYTQGDLRGILVLECSRALKSIQMLWPSVYQQRFRHITDFQNEILSSK